MDRINRLFFMITSKLRDEEGQDLVEYALVVALIALAATSGMKVLANDINAEFSNLGKALTGA